MSHPFSPSLFTVSRVAFLLSLAHTFFDRLSRSPSACFAHDSFFLHFLLNLSQVVADILRMSTSSRPLLTFALSTICLAIDIAGLRLYAGERHAFLFAGLFCLALPFFLSSAIAIAETK